MRFFRSLLTFFGVLIFLLTSMLAANAQSCQEVLNELLTAQPGMIGPGQASGLGNWYNSHCLGGQQSPPQQQYQPPPQPVVGCGGWNCPMGTSCSRVSYGVCINPGFTECATGGACPQGMQCTMTGKCMPEGNTECGNHSCAPGFYCGSRSQCMVEGTTDCGNGSSCSDGKKCSRNGKYCLAQDAVDCGSHYCNAGNKCGSGNRCLNLSDVDCGGGNFCSAGQICRKGGGCTTKEELAAEQAADEERKRLAVQAKKDEIARQKAEANAKKAELARAKEEARLAAIKKAEDEKAAAIAKAEEAKRLKREAQAAALKAAQEKVEEQKKLLAQQKEITRLQQEAKRLAEQAKIEAAAREKADRRATRVPANDQPAVGVESHPIAVSKAATSPIKLDNMTNASTANNLPGPSATRPNIYSPPLPAAQKVDMATLKQMASDPSQLPPIRQLAAALLISEYGTAAATGNGPTKANLFALKSNPISITDLQARVGQSLSQSTGAQSVSNPVQAANSSLVKTVNDPSQPLPSRQLAATGLGLNPTIVKQGIPLNVSSSSQYSGSSQINNASGTIIKLNPDTKDEVASLVAGQDPRDQNQQQTSTAPLKATSNLQQGAQSTFMKGNKTTTSAASTGNCLARAVKETVTGQVALPSPAAAGKTVALDVASAVGSTVTPSSSILGKAQTDYGNAMAVIGVAQPLAQGDGTAAAASFVETATVQAEQTLGDRIGGPVLGGVASGVTQTITDLGVMYASPILGNALYDCFPSTFTPK